MYNQSVEKMVDGNWVWLGLPKSNDPPQMQQEDQARIGESEQQNVNFDEQPPSELLQRGD